MGKERYKLINELKFQYLSDMKEYIERESVLKKQ